jgi:putative restriction endonuclease
MSKVYVGVTDRDWYAHLGQLKTKLESAADQLDEVNFWQPGGSRVFKTLGVGDLFLFKLHSPDNFIVGGGVFASSNLLPSKLAWEAFGEKNGAASFEQMQQRILKYRRSGDLRGAFTIGCILLQNPFFLERRSWVPMPEGFPLNAVQGKTYEASAPEILRVLAGLKTGASTTSAARELDGPMFGEPVPIRQRLGQGTFRVMILDAYERRCAVTGERTLPVLESAHIKPVGEGGRHATDNGLLLRSDVHRLFDGGYVTVTPDNHFRVSGRIKKEFDNGEEYYALDGSEIRLPRDAAFHPRKEFLEWHGDRCFLG